jgi:hypothetical protein
MAPCGNSGPTGKSDILPEMLDGVCQFATMVAARMATENERADQDGAVGIDEADLRENGGAKVADSTELNSQSSVIRTLHQAGP